MMERLNTKLHEIDGYSFPIISYQDNLDLLLSKIKFKHKSNVGVLIKDLRYPWLQLSFVFIKDCKYPNLLTC